MASSKTQSIALDFDTSERLNQLALKPDSSVSALAGEAIRDFLEINEFQIREVLEGLRQADRGEFADPEEIKTVFAKWCVHEA